MTKSYDEKVYCSTETKNKLMGKCRTIYLKYHPEMKNFRITEAFIMERVVEKYINDDEI